MVAYRKIRELARVIRSKNAGPYQLTFDLIFKDQISYERVKESGVISPELFARLYGISIDQVISVINYDPALAIKGTIIRPHPAGTVGESDVYGAQQHAPLFEIQIPWD